MTDERRFDEHLLQCEECWRAVQVDRAARFALEKLREPAPAGLHDRVALAVTIAAPDAPREGRRRRRAFARRRRAMAGGRWYAGGRSQPAHCPGRRHFAWLEAKGGPAEPPQVAAVAAMMTPSSSPAKALRAGEHMVIAGQ